MFPAVAGWWTNRGTHIRSRLTLPNVETVSNCAHLHVSRLACNSTSIPSTSPWYESQAITKCYVASDRVSGFHWRQVPSILPWPSRGDWKAFVLHHFNDIMKPGLELMPLSGLKSSNWSCLLFPPKPVGDVRLHESGLVSALYQPLQTRHEQESRSF